MEKCNEQDPECLVFCSPFVVDKIQTKIPSSTSLVPIWPPNKRLNTNIYALQG